MIYSYSLKKTKFEILLIICHCRMTKFTCFQYKYAIQLATLKAFETRLFCHFSYIMLIKVFRYLRWGILGLGLISPVRLDGRQDIQTLKLINLYSELKNKESQKSFLLGLTTNNRLKEHINHFVQPVTSFTPGFAQDAEIFNS